MFTPSKTPPNAPKSETQAQLALLAKLGRPDFWNPLPNALPPHPVPVHLQKHPRWVFLFI